jgi:hypothetical protein
MAACRRPIARAQRKLLEPSLDDRERRLLLDQLQLLELEKEEQDSGRIPPLASSAVSFASLDAVQRELQDDEAVLWFSLAPWKDLYQISAVAHGSSRSRLGQVSVHPLRRPWTWTARSRPSPACCATGAPAPTRGHRRPGVWDPRS